MTDYDIAGKTFGIVGGMCSASKEDLAKEISEIEEMIGSGYYEGEGDVFMQQVVAFLKIQCLKI